MSELNQRVGVSYQGPTKNLLHEEKFFQKFQVSSWVLGIQDALASGAGLGKAVDLVYVSS